MYRSAKQVKKPQNTTKKQSKMLCFDFICGKMLKGRFDTNKFLIGKF